MSEDSRAFAEAASMAMQTNHSPPEVSVLVGLSLAYSFLELGEAASALADAFTKIAENDAVQE